MCVQKSKTNGTILTFLDRAEKICNGDEALKVGKLKLETEKNIGIGRHYNLRTVIKL